MKIPAAYTRKDIINDSIATIKKVKYRIIYLSFAVFAVIGVCTMLLSLYYQLTYLVPFLFSLLCLSISPVMEVYASSHLNSDVRYPLAQGAISTTYGYFHLFMSFVKAFFFGTIAATLLWGIIFLLTSINNPQIIQELQDLLNSVTDSNGLVVPISELTSTLLIILNILQTGFVYMGFFISHQKNELCNAFSSSYLNKDKRFFLFNPLRKQIFSAIYRGFRINYRQNTWWSTLIGLLLFAIGLVGGSYIGIIISSSLSTIDPYYFGAGLGFILFGLWYGIQRVIDSCYIRHFESKIEDIVPKFISIQMESVRKVYRDGFPNGRFSPSSFPDVSLSSGVRNNGFNEDTLRKYFFLYYSSNVIDAEEYVLKNSDEDVVFTTLDSEENTVNDSQQKEKKDEKDDDSSKLVGLFGFDDFSDEEK